MKQKYRANIFRKLRRWVEWKVNEVQRGDGRSVYSQQVGKLLRSRGNEIVTMMSL